MGNGYRAMLHEIGIRARRGPMLANRDPLDDDAPPGRLQPRREVVVFAELPKKTVVRTSMFRPRGAVQRLESENDARPPPAGTRTDVVPSVVHALPCRTWTRTRTSRTVEMTAPVSRSLPARSMPDDTLATALSGFPARVNCTHDGLVLAAFPTHTNVGPARSTPCPSRNEDVPAPWKKLR